MAVSAPVLAETQRAFDAVARTYDRDNVANPIICAMRGKLLARLTAAVRPGACLLDLGCGPGTDAVALGRAGYRVIAIDWSPAMVGEARQRVAHEGLEATVDVRPIGIHELDRLDAPAVDAVYSDLGALNCVPDLAAAACAIRRRLRPGGLFVASVIGRLCPWEIARYLVTAEWRRALVRFGRGFVPVPLEGRTVWTRYYAPGEFERVFRHAGFRRRSLEALAWLTPPPYLQGFHGRHPGLMRRLASIEAGTAAWPLVRQCGDHFLLAMTAD